MRTDKAHSPFMDEYILLLVDKHVGKPCPTRRQICHWTGLSRRACWKYIHEMHNRGVLELEVREARASGRDPKNRRMRRPGREWTGWTQRGPAMLEAAE